MNRENTKITASKKALHLIRQRGGSIRTSVAVAGGIHPRTLYSLRDSGLLEPISRGVYRLAEMEPLSDPDLVAVTIRAPQAVICLISALSFHDLTTQVPHTVSIAIERGSRAPRIDHPPISVYEFSSESFHTGIGEHEIDHVTVRIYSPEKTLADCFKYRNKIGMDVVLEALKLYRARKRFDLRELLKCAKTCRVERVMKPYLEALV